MLGGGLFHVLGRGLFSCGREGGFFHVLGRGALSCAREGGFIMC